MQKLAVQKIASGFLLAATFALPLEPVSPAGAEIYYPWCINYGASGDGGGTNCGFTTLEQCRETISGLCGSCAPNSYYTGPPEKPIKHARKRAKNR